MLERCNSVICTTLRQALTNKARILAYNLTILILFLCSCTTIPAQSTKATPTPSPAPTKNTALPTPSPTSTQGITPRRYKARVVLQNRGRPDDLAFDQEGRLLFSDAHNGTVSRINANGSIALLLRKIAVPEGIVALADGTLIIAEQGPNRILSLAPGASSPKVLRSLPGTPSTARCKDGVDGIAFDPTTNTIIVPDSPTGDVYRMSLDGTSLTLLASGLVRPVGAAVDTQGNIYVADECGGALWRIAPNGKMTRFGGFGMLDDVAIDSNGNVLVTDLDPGVHALLRMNPATGQREVLANQGFIEPQGLAIDKRGNIFVADDAANIIMEYSPA